MRTDTKTLATAMRVLAAEIQSSDGVANAAIAEAAHRLDELDAEAAQQRHRADVLAATVRELRDVVTHDVETKADFIARVRAVLAADPDARVTPNVEVTGTL